MCEAIVGPEFIEGWTPELTRAYELFFEESDILPENRLDNPGLTITVNPGPPHSWYWLFVCYVPFAPKSLDPSLPKLQVPAYYLIDGSAEKSTLAADMPHIRLPPAVDIDSHSEALWKAIEVGGATISVLETEALIDECKTAWQEKRELTKKK